MRITAAALAAALLCGSAAAQGSDGSGAGLGPIPPRNVEKESREGACDPSFGGRYADLIRRLAVPDDAQRFGTCHDYGAWSGREYKGHANLPPNAYWTYSAPDWYLWARRSEAAGPAGCPDPTFGGKYSRELRRLEVPQDLGQYGRCNDYGAWSGDSYAGHANLPRGFWVYSHPYWIIYANRAGAPAQ